MAFDAAALLNAAASAASNAYVPYSGFQVGAAILTTSGKIYTGCNVENASYGLTNCAERCALFKAVSEGEREFEALALCAEGAATPCGACRQVLHEFAPELLVICGNAKGQEQSRSSLKDLLPLPFGPDFKQDQKA